jgi:hypothetical protein
VSDSEPFTLDEIRAAIGNSGSTRFRLLSVLGWFKASDVEDILGLRPASIRDSANRLAEGAPGLLERRLSGGEPEAWEYRVTKRGHLLRNRLLDLLGQPDNARHG